jgi:hypothetical protein
VIDDLSDLKPGEPITWLNVPRGGYGFAMPVDAIVRKVCAKRVRIELLLTDGRHVERVVTRASLRLASAGHPVVMAARKATIVRTRIADLAKELAAWSFSGGDEAALQRGLLCLLGTGGFGERYGRVESEVTAERGRYDVLLKDDLATIVLELKVKGSAAAVERQAQRYALTPSVDGVVVITTSNRLGAQLKTGDLGGKPFGVVVVRTYV